jgi:hypothetical protein
LGLFTVKGTIGKTDDLQKKVYGSVRGFANSYGDYSSITMSKAAKSESTWGIENFAFFILLVSG